MGSLNFELETGGRAEISMEDHKRLVLPQFHTGHSGLDCLIDEAWRGQYSSTADMLNHVENLHGPRDNRGAAELPPRRDSIW